MPSQLPSEPLLVKPPFATRVGPKGPTRIKQKTLLSRIEGFLFDARTFLNQTKSL